MPTILPIHDPDDPRIAAYRDIRERDLVGRQGLFVAEGRVVLAMLVAAGGYEAESVLVAAHRLASLGDLIAPLPDDVTVFAAAQPVLDAIAGFPMHRGILAIGRRINPPSADALLADLPADADVLVLSGIANHDNMGGLFRNAAAFGVSAVVLDAECCDPLYRKAIRVSVGGVLKVPYATMARGDDPVALLERHGFAPLALTPAGKTTLAEVIPERRNAVLLGAEGPGLAADLIARARGVRIDMATGFDSLNVATTGGIVLHHLAAGRHRLKSLS